jgi:hypothetical protein
MDTGKASTTANLFKETSHYKDQANYYWINHSSGSIFTHGIFVSFVAAISPWSTLADLLLACLGGET